MSEARPKLLATGDLSLIRTELGLDLLHDPSDYISLLLERDGLFEVAETDLVSRIVRANDVCIDAGCHIGYYSCLLAKLTGEKGRVYAFDANPEACKITRRNLVLNGLYSTEVIQAALSDRDGTATFYLSPDDQTGLSSLGPIPTHKAVISVPSLRLEAFLTERRTEHIRLLKIDVEGAEELVLKGAGRFVSDRAIDYILLECFDERLQLLDTSAQRVAELLGAAGYTAWEYRTESVPGWSKAAEVRSRGDCNYLFTSSRVSEDVPRLSLAPTLNRLLSENDKLRCENIVLKTNTQNFQAEVDKLRDDIDWLLNSIKTHEEAREHLEATLTQIQNSSSWRALNKWRKLRNSLAPENSRLRKLYDSVVGSFKIKI